MRAPKRTLAASTLCLEAFVVFFAGLVAKDVGGVPTGEALGVCGGLALACLVGAGLLRMPGGYAVGWGLQVGVLATGVWVPVMFFLGAIFVALWVTALRAGARIEREQSRIERERAPSEPGQPRSLR